MDRQELASEIRDFLGEVDEKYRSIISKLTNDLSSEKIKYLDSWAAINIWESLKASRVFESNKPNKLVSLLDDFISILIFFPIGWTWFTLWKASIAFQNYVATNPNSQLTFFELWQSGFDGSLQSEFVFTRYVQVSVFVIVALVLIYLIKGRIESYAAVKSQLLESRWEATISKLDLLLSSERGGNPARFEGLLDQAATELRDLLASGNQLVTNIKDEVATIQSNIDSVNRASDALQETIVGISEAQQSQADTFRAIHSSIDRIGLEIEKIPTNLSGSIQDSYSMVNSAMSKTVSDFSGSLSKNLIEVEKVMKSLAAVQEGYITQGNIIAEKLAVMIAAIPGLRGHLEMAGLSSQAELGVATEKWKPNQIVEEAVTSEVASTNE